MDPEILTASGLYFDLRNPERSHPGAYDIEVIASSLSKICRFTGHVSQFYSVAQHCYLASFIPDARFSFDALMHDAHEAFVGDTSSPLKTLLPDYRVVERRVEVFIRRQYGLSVSMSNQAKHADIVMLATEQRDFLNNAGHDWPYIAGIQQLPQAIEPMTPDEAKAAFLDRFYELQMNVAAA